ncbi:MAG: hypothetical protein LUE93_09965 [Bacteroides sp.]|nr:hypothetical protein [Bacteroides sp.]
MKNLIKTLFLIYLLSGCVPQQKAYLILDMVHHNPGDRFTESNFLDPSYLKNYGYTGQVINDFQFVHCAILFESLNDTLFAEESPERKWIERQALHIDSLLTACHAQGIKAYYFTDIIVLPKKIKEIYYDQICDKQGRIDLRRPKTQEIHRIMIREIFQRFPALDGLVIRVGETYLHNVPYHTGNGPIPRDETKWLHNEDQASDGGEEIHRLLIRLLQEEVCIHAGKTLIYRTWDFGFFHTQPAYYLSVTDSIPPHPDLYFAIKHVEGDYHRTFNFNPTLGTGKHKQIVEIQCQREYEGKGAYPNYIAAGVLNGFEEYKDHPGIRSLNELKKNRNFAGIWSWSPGGLDRPLHYQRIVVRPQCFCSSHLGQSPTTQ